MLTTIWRLAHEENDMFTGVICGRRGSGKSRTLIEMGRILDRASNDIPRFTMDNLCFSAGQFSKRLQMKQPRGTVVILDDAGIALYSKEALTRTVRKLGQILQSIRTQHFIILMSLPAFQMLEGHARMMTPIFMDLVGRDEKAKQNMVKVQVLDVNTFTGKIYRQTVRRDVKKEHPFFPVEITTKEPDILLIDKPPKELDDLYEKTKEEFLKPWREKKAKEIEKEEAGITKSQRYGKSFPDSYKAVEPIWNQFINDKGKIDDAMIMLARDEDGLPLVSPVHATRVARLLNQKLKKGELVVKVTKEAFLR